MCTHIHTQAAQPPSLQAGQLEVMIDHMPGTPDGLSRAPDGAFWAALLAKVPPVTKVRSVGWCGTAITDTDACTAKLSTGVF